MDTPKTLLLLGGTGFIGKSFLDAHFSGELERQGVTDLIVVARSRSGLNDYALPPDATNVEERSSRLRVVESDLATCEDLPQSDVIIHAATTVKLRGSGEDAVAGIDNVIRVTRNLSQVLRAASTHTPICYVSSGAVYGSEVTPFVPTSENIPTFSGTAIDAKSAYATAKLASEQIMTELGNDGFSVVIARAFSFMGPRLLPNHDYALSSFVAAARRDEPIRVTRTKPTFRSFMHSRDVVRWLIELGATARPGSEVFNVGSMEAFELGEVAAKVATRWNVDVIDQNRTDESLGEQRETIDWYVPDTAKARLRRGLETHITLDQFLASAREGDV